DARVLAGQEVTHVGEPRERLPVARTAQGPAGDHVRGVRTALGIPALQQAVCETGRERVPGAELVDDLLRAIRCDLDLVATGGDEGAGVGADHRAARARAE